jgi:hypothetical protein
MPIQVCRDSALGRQLLRGANYKFPYMQIKAIFEIDNLYALAMRQACASHALAARRFECCRDTRGLHCTKRICERVELRAKKVALATIAGAST